MTKSIKRIAVTGGSGQIAYSLLFRIAQGELLGSQQPIALHILELPVALQALEGVKMELDDCAFPLLKEIHIGTDPYELFKDIDYALLIGAKPRGPGMERKDLLTDNGKIFIEQGKALNAVASENVKVFVVGNPCNTNCLIAMTHAPRIPRKNFHAMMRLDQNRAKSLLAKKAAVDVTEVTNMTIWGNHSATQVPDYSHAKIGSKHAQEVIKDLNWLQHTFISDVQKRGAAIIAARGKSSAASAASALIDAVRALIHPTEDHDWFSTAICSDGNPYGISENLIFSFPCRSFGKGDWHIVPDLQWDAFISERIKITQKELLEERELISHLL